MRQRSSRARRALWFGVAVAAIATASACNGWSPLDPFQHNAPEVDQAITSIDAGKYQNAERLLAEYLKTGVCKNGNIVSAPDELLLKPNGSFDLGLTLFKLAEKFGRRFGEEEGFAEGPDDKEERAAEAACALAIVDAIAHDSKVPLDLRARAAYLAGNLKFLLRQYVQAIRSYDEALAIVPGLSADAGVDGIGRDAANNRALALRRLVEQEGDGGFQENPDGDTLGHPNEPGDGGDGGKGEQDASDDGGKGDAGGDAGEGDDDDEDNPESAGPDAGDAGKDAGAQGTPEAAGDAGRDAGPPNDDKKDQQVPATPQQGEQQKGSQQDDRMLDRLEETPSYQQQEARMRANRRRHTMEDK